MFININKNKRPVKPKYYLAKPNQEVIANMTSYVYDDSCSFKLGNIHELNMTVPYFVEKDFELIYNKDIDNMNEKMLIKMVLGHIVEWFIIDEIEDSGDDLESLSITAFSLGYELSHKKISSYEEDAVDVREALTFALEDTSWSIDWIDIEVEEGESSLDNSNIAEGVKIKPYRSFSITDSNGLDLVLQIAETFGALLEFDTVNRKISLRYIKTVDKEIAGGKYKGLSVSYDRLLRSLKRSRTTDEMVTRLYVYGNEDLSIQNVNPTGQPYIEDFSFFMYPFERDANKNVLKSSLYMSDELCNAILDFDALIDVYSPQYKTYMGQLDTLTASLTDANVQLTELNNQLDNLYDLLDVAKATEDNDLISSLNSQISSKNAEINSKTSDINSIQQSIDNVNTQIDTLTGNLSKDANFSQKLLDELKFYIIEKDFRDDRYLDEQELFNDAWKQFKKLKEPKVSLTIDIDNFLEIIEEQNNWNKLILGDYIRIKYQQMKMEYMAKITEVNYNFENSSISLTIANTEKKSEIDKLNADIYQSKSASTIINNNKYKWDKVENVDNEVYRLLNDTWDANKRAITAGVNNEISIGKRGITITDPNNPNNVVIIQSGIIALSNDGGVNWKTGITADGIIAERLMGTAFVGQRLTIQDDEGTIKLKGSLQTIQDRTGKVKVQLGEFDPNVFGLKIYDGAIKIVNGLSEDNINSASTSKWNTAEQNAKNWARSYADGLDYDLRDDLNITAPLPTSITMDSTGITAYTTYDYSRFARLDYRGLYVQGGAIDIRTNSSYSNRGVILDSGGLRGYNNSGTLTFSVNSSDGSAVFAGTLQSAIGVFNGTVYVGNASAYTTIQGNWFESYGTYSRNWNGSTTTNSVKIRIENGYIRARNDTLDQSLYISDFGISTYADATASDASGSLLFRDTKYSGSSTKGLTVHSTNGIVSLTSATNSVMINPMENSRTGNNTFRFYVKDNDSASDTDGVIVYGSRVNTYGSGIRFSKSSSDNSVWITNGFGDKNTGILRAYNVVASNSISANSITSGGSRVLVSSDLSGYLSSGSTASSLTINNLWLGGSLYYSAGYLTAPSGSLSISQNTVKANTVTALSNADFKKNIVDWDYEALPMILNTPIRQYQYKTELDEEFPHVGIIVQEAPVWVVSIDGDGVEPYKMSALAWKAIQEEDVRITSLENEVELLKAENTKIKQVLADNNIIVE